MWVNNVEADIYLEEVDLLEGDSGSLKIKVDKNIFDDYIQGSYINIQFVDVDNDPVTGYVMIGEDDEGVFMEMLSSAV